MISRSNVSGSEPRRRGRRRAPIALLGALILAGGLAPARVAAAAKKRVVMLNFAGPGAKKAQAQVAAQLRTFNADGSTLPLPVPRDYLTSSMAEVNGAPATVLASRDKTLAAVLWVADGKVTAVAGVLDAGEVLSEARGLR